MSEKYLDNRLKYHAASRVGSQQGQALLQALTLDGHSVNTKKVWASLRFPENTSEWKTKKDGYGATQDLVSVFKALPGTVSSAITGGGTKWTNPNYDVTLYENVLMSPVEGSNGSGQNYEAYEFKENGIRVQDWVSPMAAFDSSINAPIPGFTGMFDATTSTTDTGWKKLEDDSQWVLASGTWQFMYIGGMLTFNAAYTPAGKNYKQIRMTAFAYTGKYLDTVIEQIKGGGSQSASGLVELSGKFEDFTTGLAGLEAIKLSGDLSGKTFYLGLAPSSALSQSNEGLKSTLRLEKLLEPTASGYAASYQLKDADGNVFGDTIDIAKDQFLKDVKFIPSATQEHVTEAGGDPPILAIGDPCVRIEYYIVTGAGEYDTKVTYINLKALVDTYTGVSGVAVNGYTISGVVDPTSDGFFTVGADGFKVAGVSDAIDNALETAKTYTDTASGYIIKDGSFANHTVSLTRMDGNNTGFDIKGIAASGEIISGLNFANHTLTATDKAAGTLTATGIAADDEVAKSATFVSHTVSFKNSSSTELFNVGGIAASGEIISGGSFNRETGVLSLSAKDAANSFTITGLIKEGDISALASGKMDKLTAANVNEIVIVSGDGNALNSGYKLGNGTFVGSDDKLVATEKAVSGFVDNKINALDFTDTAVTDEFVTKVDEADGKISVARGKVAASGVIRAATTGLSGVAGTTAEAAITDLGNKIGVINGADTIEGSIKKAVKDQATIRAANDDVICGAVSGAWSSNEIVIGKTDGIKKSGYTLNGTSALTDSSTIVPSQHVVSAFVGGKINDVNTGLNTLSSALTGYLGVSAVVTEFNIVKQSITDEENARKDADTYISGAISGFTSTNTVSAAIKAVNDKVDALDYTLPSQAGKFINHIEQVNGKVSGTLAEVYSNYVKYGTASNVGAEIDKIELALTDYISGSAVKNKFIAVDTAISNEINRAIGVEDYLSGVLSGYNTVGAVSAAIKAVSDAAISVSGVTGNAVTVTANGTNRQIKLNINNSDKILSQTADGLSATIGLKKLQTGISSGNASEYILTDKDGNQIGDKIEIYKDQFLSGVQLVEDPEKAGNFTLRFTFKLANDNPQTIDVPLSGMFHEYKGKSGVEVKADGNAFTISGVVDPANDNEFLSVGANGFKVSGVSTAIATAKSEAILSAHSEITALGQLLPSASFSSTNTVAKKIADQKAALTGMIKTVSGYIVDTGAFENHAVTLTRKDSNNASVVINGIAASGEIISGGTFNRSTGTLTLGRKDDTSFDVTGLIKEGDVSALASGKVDKITDTGSHIIVTPATTSGAIVATEFTLGTDTDVISSATTAKLVATELAVKTALTGLKDYADATFMNQLGAIASGEIIIGGTTIDTVTGSGFKLGTDSDVLTGELTDVPAKTVATERFVYNALSWETLT